MHPIGGMDDPLGAEQVADLLESVFAANGRVAAEAERLAGSRASVSEATIERFTRLAAGLRPAVEARAILAGLDPELLLAGTAVWRNRRRGSCAGRDTGLASTRAAARWSPAAR